MRKLVIAALLALASNALAQLPATMTSFGASLPSRTTRVAPDTCENLVGSLGTQVTEFECYMTRESSTALQHRVFEMQTSSLRAAGFALITEGPLEDTALGQLWRNEARFPNHTLGAVYIFLDSSVAMIFTTIPD